MAQEIAIKREIPPATPQISKSLSPQQLSEHRAKIAFDVKTVLSAYFQPHEAEEVRAAQLAWWCDELQDWTQEQVLWALRKWNRDNPRLRPTPGDIVAICKKARGQKIAAQLPKQEPAPERKPVDPDTAARIMAEAGFAPKRFDAGIGNG
jgi:hypothetical protein